MKRKTHLMCTPRLEKSRQGYPTTRRKIKIHVGRTKYQHKHSCPILCTEQLLIILMCHRVISSNRTQSFKVLQEKQGKKTEAKTQLVIIGKWLNRVLNRFRFANDFRKSLGGIFENIGGCNSINWYVCEEIQGWHFFFFLVGRGRGRGYVG